MHCNKTRLSLYSFVENKRRIIEEEWPRLVLAQLLAAITEIKSIQLVLADPSFQNLKLSSNLQMKNHYFQ